MRSILPAAAPIGSAVVDLQVANQLTNAGVTAGDTLVIPAP